MSLRLAGFQLSSVGVLATILLVLDKAFAQLDNYAPEQEYPIYSEVPAGLSFTCDDKIPGYYADPETRCQVWHWCVPGIGGNDKYSFLCAPGTAFSQRTRVCDFIDRVDCQNAPSYYAVNEDLYKDFEGNYIQGKKDDGYKKHKVNDLRRLTARQKRRLNVRNPNDTQTRRRRKVTY